MNGAPPNFHQIFVPQSLIASKKGIFSVTFLEKAKENLNRRKLYPARLRSYLSDMQFVRDKADYTDGNVSRKMARRMLSKPDEMIRHIGGEIEK